MNTILQEQIEQAARRYCQDMNYMLPDDMEPSLETLTAMDAFKAGVNWALQNQWVSVEDGLPESSEYVLAHMVDRHEEFWSVVRFYPNGCATDGHGIWKREAITHWMSIPSLEGGEK